MPPSQHALSKQVMKNWDFWEKKIANATNKRMLEEWVLHKPQKIKATSTIDLDPPPLAANDHPSVLSHEMFALEPGRIKEDSFEAGGVLLSRQVV